MKRFLISFGDRTTAGGVVIQGDEGANNDGTPLAYRGAPIYYHSCESTGVLCNVPPYRPMTFKGGRQVGLENDFCPCECKPYLRLIASRQDMSMLFDADELAALGFLPDGRFMPKDSGVFDEQVKVVGKAALEGYPYLIEMMDGRTFKGRPDARGQLPRICTDSVDDYHVYWGDEALVKLNGA